MSAEQREAQRYRAAVFNLAALLPHAVDRHVRTGEDLPAAVLSAVRELSSRAPRLQEPTWIGGMQAAGKMIAAGAPHAADILRHLRKVGSAYRDDHAIPPTEPISAMLLPILEYHARREAAH